MTSTATRPTTAPSTVDPDRWPDVAAAAGSPARAAVARAVFGTAVARLPVRVRLADGSADSRAAGGGTGRPRSCTCTGPASSSAGSARSGLIGFGESYMAGDWDSTDLTGLLTVFAAHAADLVPPWLQRLRGWPSAASRRHDLQTVAGARRNIGRHYDLSNDLFALFLDETMTYSCALFPERDGVPVARRTSRKRSTARSTGSSTAPGWGRAAGCSRSAPAGASWPSGPPAAAPTVRTITISARAARARRPPGRRGRAGRPGQRGAARLPRRRRPVRRDLLGRDARGGRRALLGRLLRRPRPAPGPGRADRAADDHDGARPDAGHPAHLHLDPEVHLPRRPAPVRHRDRGQPGPHPAADHRARGLRRPLRRDAADLAGTVRRRGPTTSPASASTRCSTGCGPSTCATPRPASGPGTSTSASSPWPGPL